MAGWRSLGKDALKWEGTLHALGFVGGGSELTDISMRLDEVDNPDVDVDFNFGNNKSLTFRSVDRTPVTDEGIFNFEARGNFTGDLVHIHQHTGNAGVGTIGLRIEAEDADLLPLQTSGSGTWDIKTNKGFESLTTVSGANISAAGVDVGTHMASASIHNPDGAIVVVFDGGGSAIASGTQIDIRVPWTATIDRATILGDQTGSLAIVIWNDTYANFPPTSADDISGSGLLIGNATKVEDTTLIGWTAALSAGDILRFNASGVAVNITRATVVLEVVKG